jgi:hypothetical protein
MTDFSPFKPQSERKIPLTEKQEALIANIWKCNGDILEAAKMAGYSDPYRACRDLKDEIREEMEYALTRLAGPAIHQTKNIMLSEDGVKQASEKLKAIQLVLERTNPKTDKVDVNVESKGGVFVLPAKRPLDEPEEV